MPLDLSNAAAAIADSLHLLIPYAAGGSDPARAAIAGLPLPNLRRLLASLTLERTIETTPDDPALPHELARAAALGLPGAPGRLPWAAFETGTIGVPCAYLTLCHWQAALDQVQVLDPAALALDDAESRALLDAAAPWLAEDGITLAPRQAGVWLATGEPLRDLATISLDRVLERPVARELLPAGGAAQPALARLQSELQMLFYDHPLTDARMQQRRLYPNGVWISGAGVLAEPVGRGADPLVEPRLARPTADPQAFAAAWRAVDAGSIRELAARGAQGDAVRLTLCGERRALTFVRQPGGWLRRLAQRLGADTPAAVLAAL